MSSAGAQKEDAPRPLNGVAVFAAQMADNNWVDLVTNDDVGFRDAYLGGVALSRELAGTDYWAVEVEGQIVRHFGDQDHWEFNGALIGRWRGFPWSDTVNTALAFGVGPSYATQVPPEEIARDGESAKFLLYWVVELEIGPGDSPWSGLARLHHRSNAYGVLAEDGGSNWVTIGVRRRF